MDARKKVPLFYAEGRHVFKRSIVTPTDDGSATFTLSFRVCEASEEVGEHGAKMIAAVLSAACADEVEEPSYVAA